MKRLIVLVACMALLMGCTPLSLNAQRASIRGAADVAVTMSLDAVPVESVGTVKAEVKGIAEAVLAFLDTGSAAALTHSALRVKLRELVPEKYRSYFDTVMSIASEQVVDLEAKIGPKMVKRLKAGAVGVLSGCAQYANEDRPPPKEEDT